MKIKLTLERPAGGTVDLAVVVEPTSTIGAVAGELRAADKDGPAFDRADPVTLRRHPRAGHPVVLDPLATVADAGLASGDTVSLAKPGAAASASTLVPGAVVSIVQGPGTGARFDLPVGTASIGRDPSNRVQLDDPLVSKTHARLRITDSVEIVDQRSANGTMVNGRVVERAIVTAGDLITVGDTVLSIAAIAQEAAIVEDGIVQFNRSPRLDPPYTGTVTKAPEIPEKPKPSRFPVLAMIAPLLLGGVLIFLMPNNPFIFLFIALSPLLMLGSWIDGLLQARREWKTSLREFRGTLAEIAHDVPRRHAEERAGRERESPSSGEVLAHAGRFEPLLWTRRPEHDSFLGLRLGVGAMPSRHRLELPDQRRGPADLWQELTRVAASLGRIESVPVVESFPVCGSIGIAGPLDDARAVARATIAQLAGLHSPAEVSIAGIASTVSADAWDWMKWLPHVGSVHGPISAPPLGAGGPDSTALLAELEEIVAARVADTDRAGRHLPAVVVLVEDDAPVDRARLVSLAERGPAASVHFVWVAPSVPRIPAACRTFLDLTTAGGLTGFVRTGDAVTPVVCERLDVEAAYAFARTLAPAIDAGAPVDDESDLPRAVSLLSLLGAEIADDPEAVIARWRETHSILTGPRANPPRTTATDANLRAVFGLGPTESFALDLRADGPHALVGGTTGSGKSEFLQSWVLGMATAHSPQRINFLFVDYKGGTAFSKCVELPHAVGIVTDLNPHLVRRVLASLDAEIKRRERLFGDKGVGDILDFERKHGAEAPPVLVIVVDEFAALVGDVPEFVAGVVDIAQRGRALGLHLVLATQRPAGVIGDNLRANTNLRIALRMSDDSESLDVLGDPLAADFDPLAKGRAAVRLGTGRIRSFQTGYAGGWTHGEVLSPPSISELRFGSGEQWQSPPDPEAEAAYELVKKGPKDIARIVSTVVKAAREAGLRTPDRPWLDELEKTYDLRDLKSPSDAALAFGMLDEPESQTQRVAFYRPDDDETLAVIGTGGSGKTTVLRTLAVSAALARGGGPVHVYGIDFGTGTLGGIADLPHVGAVIPSSDEEGLGRLLRWLREIVEERGRRYAGHGDTIQKYRDATGSTEEPRILVLLDGLAAFRDQYESSSNSPFYPQFLQVATSGRAVGVHVVVTADRFATIGGAIASSIQKRLVLRLANRDDYSSLDVPADVLGVASPPGRGLLGKHEVQAAIVGGDASAPVQKELLEKLAESVRKSGVALAAPVRRLPDVVGVRALADDPTAIGIADDTLEPVTAEIEGGFIVAGPDGSGRSNALTVLARSLLRRGVIESAYLLSARKHQAGEVAWTATAAGVEAIGELLPSLQDAVAAAEKRDARIGIFVEGITALDDSDVETPLEELLRAAIRGEHAVVGEAETSTWSDSYTLGKLVRASRRGLILCPEENDEALLRTTFGRISGAFPPGRGYLVDGPSARKVQVVDLGVAGEV